MSLPDDPGALPIIINCMARCTMEMGSAGVFKKSTNTNASKEFFDKLTGRPAETIVHREGKPLLLQSKGPRVRGKQ